MKIVDKISLQELQEMAQRMFGNLVKADVDIEKGIVIIDMEMHVDGEQELLLKGSKQADIWGINLKPDQYGTADFIEFDSMINIRPRQNNTSRFVMDEQIRARITEIIQEVVYE